LKEASSRLEPQTLTGRHSRGPYSPGHLGTVFWGTTNKRGGPAPQRPTRQGQQDILPLDTSQSETSRGTVVFNLATSPESYPKSSAWTWALYDAESREKVPWKGRSTFWTIEIQRMAAVGRRR
jgi:hypothetical protein